jgi:gas vesicle protein
LRSPAWQPVWRVVLAAETDFNRRISISEESAMADNDSGSGIGGFGWFLAGLGIGALVGVLYAPKSGKETRDDLVARSLEARDKAAELYSQGVEQAGQYVQQGKEIAGQYVQQGKEVAGQYVDKGKEYYDKGRTQWTQYVEKGKDLIQTQADAVSAAVDAGKEAYVKTATPAPAPGGQNS